MGTVVQLRPDHDQRLAAAWDALLSAHRLALTAPSIRNMVQVARAWEAWEALAGPSHIAAKK